MVFNVELPTTLVCLPIPCVDTGSGNTPYPSVHVSLYTCFFFHKHKSKVHKVAIPYSLASLCLCVPVLLLAQRRTCELMTCFFVGCPSIMMQTSLNLSYNDLTSFPDCVLECTSLQDLNLDHNLLTTIPAEVQRLQSLVRLTISFNSISCVLFPPPPLLLCRPGAGPTALSTSFSPHPNFPFFFRCDTCPRS